ncbi:MAG: ABC transporter permease subunit [Actinomycetales bacterium]|nr:ABC transporter permease subunit [Actinomycetales bacterium]
MILPLTRRALADSWRSLLVWALGVAGAVSLYVPLYPSIGGNADMQALLDSLPPELIKTLNYEDIATGAGYVQSTFYGLLGFVLLVIMAAAWGTGAVAGDEEAGSLELTLAHGVGRVQLVLERALAILVKLLVITLVAGGLVLAYDAPAGLGLEVGDVAAMSASWLGLGVLCATAALALGALTGRRVWALTAGAGVAVVGYVLNALANQNADLDDLHAVSPYYWMVGASPLAEGWDGRGLALLWGISAALVAVAALALARRDLKS